MGEVNHEQVNLMLRLYDLRREPRLREARSWFFTNFHASSIEEMMAKFPPGSEANVNFRMTASYWDMVASIVNRGLIDEEFFFESNGEQWMVWDRLRNIVPAMRALFKNPHMFANLEENVKRLEAWREKRAPGSNAAMRQVMEQMARGQTQAKAAGD